jgi:sterol desaturase/sphingolipid hydroxylase (fatty acid hydroxylase superfamily)
MISALAGGVLLAEVAGYGIHRLLHSGRVAWLTAGHMIHHQARYPPTRLRSEVYLDPTVGRGGLAGIGGEWLVPIAVVLAGTWAALTGLGVPRLPRGVVCATALVWGWVMFDLVHTQFHLRTPWLGRVPGLARWFRRARRRHDLHHVLMDARGRMVANFGITSRWVDQLAGTARG